MLSSRKYKQKLDLDIDLISAGLRLWRPWCTQKNAAPKIQLGGLGERCELPSRVWGGAAEPQPGQPKSNLVYYRLKYGSNFNYFSENQPTKFSFTAIGENPGQCHGTSDI